MMTGFKLLAGLKGLRGTPFDLFGYSNWIAGSNAT